MFVKGKMSVTEGKSGGSNVKCPRNRVKVIVRTEAKKDHNREGHKEKANRRIKGGGQEEVKC